MRLIDTEERRARLGRHHGLSQPVNSPEEAASSVLGLHSSDPATVFLSCWARVEGFQTEDLERALYEDKSLVRILGMRRTMWIVRTGEAPTINSSSTKALADYQMRRTAKLIEDADIATDGLKWTKSMIVKTREAMRERGPVDARELVVEVPELGERIEVHKKDGSLAGSFGASTRILFLMSTLGQVVRAKPKGTWISSQYRWTLTKSWLGGPFTELDPQAARAETLKNWLEQSGPATETDLKWWTGWNLGQVRQALEDISATTVRLDIGVGFLPETDTEPVLADHPWIALLPGLDPTTMGWKERDWYIGDLSNRLFDRNGNAGPTIWADGQVVGGWAQRPTGEIVIELLIDVGSETRARIEARAEALEDWLQPVVVTPRFRTPLEKEMVSPQGDGVN
jgi:hypothetical protein